MEVTEGLDEAIRRDGLRAIGWTPGARDPALTDIARLAAHVADTPMAAVTVLVDGRQWYLAAVGLEVESVPKNESLCARLLDDGEMVIVEDAHADVLRNHAFVVGEPRVRFYAGVPLCVPRERSLVGTVCVMGREPRTLAAAQREYVLLLASQAAVALELRRRDTELAIARTQLADAVDVARIVTWHRVLPGGETTWFGPIREVLGATKVEPRLLRNRIHPDDRFPILAELGDQLANGGTLRRECRVVGDDGVVRWVHIHSRVELKDGKPVLSTGTVLDITETREKEISLSHVLARVDDAVVGLDRDLRVTYLNPSAVATSGKTEAEQLGKRVDEIWPLEETDNVMAAMRAALHDRKPLHVEERFAPLDRYFEFRLYPSTDGVTLFATDVTAERKAAAAQADLLARMRALAARVQDIREEEGQRIARELHDQLGQELTVLKLDAARLAKTATGEAAVRLADMLVQLDAIADLVRQIAMRLRPQLLDDLGLAAAVDWQARELARRSGLHVTVDAETFDLPAAPSVALFRVLQEILTNVVRHAGATAIAIRLAREDGHVCWPSTTTEPESASRCRSSRSACSACASG